MSNHSSEHPDGILSNDALKSFHGITTSSNGSLIYTIGTERIPSNWYRRPISDDYNSVHGIADFLELGLLHPQLLIPGGNINGVNTFVPLNLTAFTNGVYNPATLLEGDNLACFLFQATTILVPDALDGVLGLASVLVGHVLDAFGDLLDTLTCPQLTSVNQELLMVYPGYRKTTRPV
jgi:hypothetical protein